MAGSTICGNAYCFEWIGRSGGNSAENRKGAAWYNGLARITIAITFLIWTGVDFSPGSFVFQRAFPFNQDLKRNIKDVDIRKGWPGYERWGMGKGTTLSLARHLGHPTLTRYSAGVRSKIQPVSLISLQ